MGSSQVAIQIARLRRRELVAVGIGMALGAPAILRGARPALAQQGLGITDELIKAAQDEGSISYYHNSDIDTTVKWTEAFSKKYGIEMKNMRMPSYPLFDRWLNEERVGRHLADLIQITDPTLLSYANEAGLRRRLRARRPARDIPDDVKEKGVWYGLFTDAMGIGYNGSKVTPEEEKLIQTGGWAALGRSALEGPLRHRHAGLGRQLLRLLLHVPGDAARPVRRRLLQEVGRQQARHLCQQGAAVRAPGRRRIRADGPGLDQLAQHLLSQGRSRSAGPIPSRRRSPSPRSRSARTGRTPTRRGCSRNGAPPSRARRSG